MDVKMCWAMEADRLLDGVRSFSVRSFDLTGASVSFPVRSFDLTYRIAHQNNSCPPWSVFSPTTKSHITKWLVKTPDHRNN